MANTFSGSNSELYEISNVDQLVGLRSEKDRSFRVAVRHTKLDDAIYTSVIIYNELINVDIISMLTSCENDFLGVDDAIISEDQLVSIMASFGFNIRFVNKEPLSEETVHFLRSIYEVGFRYFCFTTDGVYVFMTKDGLGSKASIFANFDKCDFSKLTLSDEPQSFYNIGDYI